MQMSRAKRGAALTALLSVTILSGCNNVASLDCNEIAEKAKAASQTHEVKIQNIANARETSRTDADARCTADATWSDGANMTVYVRAYEEGENLMIAYQAAPFP